MKTNLHRVIFATSLLGTGCASEDKIAPFELELEFVNINPAVVDSLRVTLQTDTGQSFEMFSATMYEDDSLTSEVDGSGNWVLTMTQPYIAAHTIDDPRTPEGPILTLELQAQGNTDDQVLVSDPLARAVAYRSGTAIGEGTRYVPWPLLSGQTAQLDVSCGGPASSMCE